MSDHDGYAEAVLLFDPQLNGIELELHVQRFHGDGRRCRGDWSSLPRVVVYAAFAVVGAALALRSVVFFTFKVDEEGTVDPSFNLPLRYLADNAGPGPDLGTGIRASGLYAWSLFGALAFGKPVGTGSTVHRAVTRYSSCRKSSGAISLGLRPTGTIDRERRGFAGTDGFSQSVLDRVGEPQGSLRCKPDRNLRRGQGKVNLENLIRQHNDTNYRSFRQIPAGITDSSNRVISNRSGTAAKKFSR